MARRPNHATRRFWSCDSLASTTKATRPRKAEPVRMALLAEFPLMTILNLRRTQVKQSGPALRSRLQWSRSTNPGRHEEPLNTLRSRGW